MPTATIKRKASRIPFTAAQKAVLPTPDEIDRAKLTHLCADLAAGLHEADEMEARINRRALDATKLQRAEYDGQNVRLEALQRDMTALVQAHPDWFSERKSLVTPFGTIKLVRADRLKYDSATAVIDRLRAQSSLDGSSYIRVTEELDVEALERLPEEELQILGITWDRRQKINFVALKIAPKKPAKPAK